MPNVYPPNSWVPELNGTASGGVSVVLHKPQDLELLYAFSGLAPHPPAAPLKSLAAALADPRLDLLAWHREWASDAANVMPSSAVGPDPKRGSNNVENDDDRSDLSALRNVLVVLKTVWEAEPADIPLMSCVITIESDAGGRKEGVSWDTAAASLTFGRGSIDVWLGRGTRQAGSGRRNRCHREGAAPCTAGPGPRTRSSRGPGAAAGCRGSHSCDVTSAVRTEAAPWRGPVGGPGTWIVLDRRRDIRRLRDAPTVD
jgi:hypothetical protein